LQLAQISLAHKIWDKGNARAKTPRTPSSELTFSWRPLRALRETIRLSVAALPRCELCGEITAFVCGSAAPCAMVKCRLAWPGSGGREAIQVQETL
jgi:hypothetical protein